MITYTVNVDEIGTQEWFHNGLRHREDGPSVITTDGSQEWHRNGKRHCEDGPAVICASGTRYWYLDDIKYTEKKFNEKMKAPCADKIIEIEGKKYKLTAV